MAAFGYCCFLPTGKWKTVLVFYTPLGLPQPWLGCWPIPQIHGMGWICPSLTLGTRSVPSGLREWGQPSLWLGQCWEIPWRPPWMKTGSNLPIPEYRPVSPLVYSFECSSCKSGSSKVKMGVVGFVDNGDLEDITSYIFLPKILSLLQHIKT